MAIVRSFLGEALYRDLRGGPAGEPAHGLQGQHHQAGQAGGHLTQKVSTWARPVSGGGRGAHMPPTRARAPSPILIREVPHTVYFILVVQKAILIIIKAKRFVYFIIEIHHLVPFVKEFYNAVSFYNT